MAKNKPIYTYKKKTDYILIVLRVSLLIPLLAYLLAISAPGLEGLAYILYSLIAIAIIGFLYGPYLLIKRFVFKGSISIIDSIAALILFVASVFLVGFVINGIVENNASNRRAELRQAQSVEYKLRVKEGCRSVYDFNKDDQISTYNYYLSQHDTIKARYAEQKVLVKNASNDCFSKKINSTQMISIWIDAKRAIQALGIEVIGQEAFDKLNVIALDQSNCTMNGSPCPVIMIDDVEDFLSKTES